MNDLNYPCFKCGDVFYASLYSEGGDYQPVICIKNDYTQENINTTLVALVELYNPNSCDLSKNKKESIYIGSKLALDGIAVINKKQLVKYITSVDDYFMKKIIRAINIHFGKEEFMHKGEYNICLCPRCAGLFYDMPDHGIKRATPFQKECEPCNICGYHKGYDFKIWPKTFSKGSVRRV